MFSYVLQALSFILLRVKQPTIERPFVSPFGIPGAAVTMMIAIVTIMWQLYNPDYRWAVAWVMVWFAVAILYFALVGRHRMVLSPEEKFAIEHRRA